MMDVQLSLPAHFMPVAQPIATIIKRDGRRMPFNTIKIANAIARAARSVGENEFDRAESFASAVSLSLAAQLGSETPTVDHVHDAVERVLLEMGYHRIALAYVRYRDRRGRMRELREADPHSIQEALSDARRERGTQPTGSARHRFVRTSRDTFTHWGRDRIVDTLVRETGLDQERAERIAREVEALVQRARLSSVPAPVIRELVGAKLIEHGLEEHHRRHVRLGVPLYDVDQLLTDPHREAPSEVHDPATTETLLARRVKREYALTRVFSPETAEAHQRGDIHIHYLEQIDRLESLSLSLEYLKRFGLSAIEGRSFSRAARSGAALIGQIGRFSEGLQRCLSDCLEWQAVNLQMAPYIVELDRYILRDAAHDLLLEFVYREAGLGIETPRVRLEVVWDVPSSMAGQEALGPGGTPAGRPYEDFLPTAREFAWAIVDAYEGLLSHVECNLLPDLCVVVTPAALYDGRLNEFLERLYELLRSGAVVRFRCDRESPWLPLAENGFSAREVHAQTVTLNLPRLAYTNFSDAEFYRELEETFDIAARAHVEKFEFLRRLFDREGAGPLARLCVRRGESRLLYLEETQFLVGVAGLEQCVRAFRGAGLDSEQGSVFAADVLARLQSLAARWASDSGISISLTATRSPFVLQRLADMDLDHYGYYAQQVLDIPDEGTPVYSPGASAPDSEADETARLRCESPYASALPSTEMDMVLHAEDGEAAEFTGRLSRAFEALDRVVVRAPRAAAIP